MAGALAAGFWFVIGVALITRSYLPLIVEFKQMSNLQQRVRLDQWPREFAHFVANAGIKHPGWNPSARTIRQSSHEHVGSNFNDLQIVAQAKQRVKRIVKFQTAPQAGSVRQVCWSAPTNPCRPSRGFLCAYAAGW